MLTINKKEGFTFEKYFTCRREWYKKGNTSKLADDFCEGATKAGHKINKVFLGDKELSGCNGCEACKCKNRKCIIKDDMQEIYLLFEQCDTIVLASPLYFWTISAKTKAFIERLYAISENDQYPYKESVFIAYDSRSSLKEKFIDEKYLQNAYELGTSI